VERRVRRALEKMKQISLAVLKEQHAACAGRGF
jgi:hypothetical protein